MKSRNDYHRLTKCQLIELLESIEIRLDGCIEAAKKSAMDLGFDETKMIVTFAESAIERSLKDIEKALEV